MVAELLQHARQNLEICLWAMKHVPMLFWIKPKVLELNDEKSVVVIPLGRRQKNHLNSMYIGALVCGADLASGLMAFRRIKQSSKKVSFVFKDFQAEFHQRAMAQTQFTCLEGPKIDAMIAKTLSTKERVSETVTVVASCPSLSLDPVATFRLTLSVKASKD